MTPQWPVSLVPHLALAAAESESRPDSQRIITFCVLSAAVLSAAFFDVLTTKPVTKTLPADGDAAPVKVQEDIPGRIPNWLTYSWLLTAFVLAAALGYFAGGWDGAGLGLKHAGIGFLAGFVPFFIIFTMRACGGADVKLAATIGAFGGGWEFVLYAVFYGVMINALIAIGIMIRRRIVKETISRIANAALMAASRVKPNLDSGHRVPMAVGLALGAILAGVELLLEVRLPWSLR